MTKKNRNSTRFRKRSQKRDKRHRLVPPRDDLPPKVLDLMINPARKVPRGNR